jgi:hypothetical protein
MRFTAPQSLASQKSFQKKDGGTTSQGSFAARNAAMRHTNQKPIRMRGCTDLLGAGGTQEESRISSRSCEMSENLSFLACKKISFRHEHLETWFSSCGDEKRVIYCNKRVTSFSFSWQTYSKTSLSGISFDLIDFYHHRLTLYGVDSRALNSVDCARILRMISEGFESGALRPPSIAMTVPIADAVDAYVRVAEGSARGKVVFSLA